MSVRAGGPRGFGSTFVFGGRGGISEEELGGTGARRMLRGGRGR